MSNTVIRICRNTSQILSRVFRLDIVWGTGTTVRTVVSTLAIASS
jgi:hypothetical protein